MTFIGVAQEENVMEFSGVLKTSGDQLVTFKLLIEEYNEGTFNGFSTTDFDGEDYTQSIVQGKLDLDNGIISFKELRNTETKSTAEASTFCYITVDNLAIKSTKGNSVTNGEFIGEFPSGETCATGQLILTSETSLEAVKEKLSRDKVDSVKVMESRRDTTDLIMTANERVLIDEWKNEVKLEVWDGDKQDSDVIDIYLNGKLFQERVLLRNKKKVFELPSDRKEFELKIVARSEGHLGVNTVNFHLINASDTNNYVSELNKGDSFVIFFKKRG